MLGLPDATIAIVYALIGFIGTVFIALFIRQRGRI